MAHQNDLKQASELMQQFAAFKLEHPEGSLTAFGIWLQLNEPDMVPTKPKFDVELVIEGASKRPFQQLAPIPGSIRTMVGNKPLDALLGILIRRLSKHASSYLKRILESQGLRNIDDLFYLSHLDENGPTVKTELIQASLNEFTGGIEIINRLKKGGLVTEEQDTKDKRRRIVTITEAGRTLKYAMHSHLAKASKVVWFGLSDTEKLALLNSLEYLDHMHSHLGVNYKHASVQDVLSILEGEATS